MKYFIALVFVFVFSVCALSQNIKLAGTVFDPNGAVIVDGQIKAVDEKNRSVVGKSGPEGLFEISLVPGIYAIEVSSPGFLTLKYSEFLVVNAWSGKMAIDFVLFGGKYHEPCGFSGSECLPAKSLIRSYEVKYSPKLKDIRDEFAPVPKSKEKKID
ncbi:MAG: carboxypeptidase-like regulatory domain-containing protein [Acidobacteriota bacterium]